MTQTGDARWRLLLTVSDSVWLEEERGREGRLCFGDARGEHRPVRLEAPLGCLPLLERPFVDVLAELRRTAATSGAVTRRALEQLVPGGVIEMALQSESSYWLAGAVAWLGAMDPSERASDQAFRILHAPAAEQSTRHAARRIHRRWTEPAPGR